MTNHESLVEMFRPVGPGELALLEENGFTKWPARLPSQPIFYPVTNEAYAREITQKWNVRDYGAGYVTRFYVAKSFADRYSIQRVGANGHDEWWIPAEDLNDLNEAIVGQIELVASYEAVRS